MGTILKNKVFLAFILLTLGVSKCQEKKAYKIYNHHLLIIKERLEKKPWQSLNDVNLAIEFFERVTGIKSHSDGNYFGRFDPTDEDYTNWLNWYKNNYQKLYWDVKTQEVKSQ